MGEILEADKERKITLNVGDEAPLFCLKNGEDDDVCLKDFIGKR